MSTELLQRPARATSNGHSPVSGDDPFAQAFDAGEVTWADDLPVFDAALRAPASRGGGLRAAAASPLADLARSPDRAPLAGGVDGGRPVRQPPRVQTPEAAPAPAQARIIRLRPSRTPVSPAHLAWLALVPTCLVAVAAFGWLAPAIAPWVTPDATWRALPSVRKAGLIHPEPVDQVRYLVGLAAPLMVVGLVYVAWKQVSGLPARPRLAMAVIAVQVAALAFLAVCWVLQRRHLHWFSGWDTLAGVGIACALLLVATKTRFFAAAVTRQPRAVGWAALVAVITVSGLWLLPAVFHDSNLADAHFSTRFHLQFTYDEFLSVVNGRTPLVDFAPLYSRLLPFAVEPVMGIFGATVGTFTWTMWVLSLIAVVAVYLTFRTVTGSPLPAVVLYLPFLAMTLFPLVRVGDEWVFLANLHGLVPLRVVGPFVLAWLCAVQLKRAHRHGPLVLFVLAGLAAVNNPEFGLSGLLAVLVALWCGRDPAVPDLRLARTYVAQAAAGLLISIALVSLLTLVRSSSLPRLDYLNHFQRVFAVEGFGMLPMPSVGPHLAIYLTFVAALVGAVSIVIKGCPPEKRVLTAMLAYSGVLGLGSLSYWVGRSHPVGLFALFPTWSFSAALLAWWVLSGVAHRSAPSPATVRVWALPSLTVLTVFGLMASVVTNFPAPGAQMKRVGGTAESKPHAQPSGPLDSGSSFDRSAAARFVSDHTRPGERVGILASIGHGIAERSGVVNTSPYSHQDSIGFEEQIAFVLGDIEESGARKIFLGPAYPEIAAYLERRGYEVTARSEESGLSLYSPKRCPAAPRTC